MGARRSRLRPTSSPDWPADALDALNGEEIDPQQFAETLDEYDSWQAIEAIEKVHERQREQEAKESSSWQEASPGPRRRRNGKPFGQPEHAGAGAPSSADGEAVHLKHMGADGVLPGGGKSATRAGGPPTRTTRMRRSCSTRLRIGRRPNRRGRMRARGQGATIGAFHGRATQEPREGAVVRKKRRSS